ncbi:cytochrome P450 [Fomitopsis betulina]|nr:cytochrome P450 [Fomitopsis betulina]
MQVALSTSIFLLVLVLAGSIWLFLIRTDERLPPGPRGRPVLGQYGQIPSSGPWQFFRDLGRTYGPVSSIHVLGHPVIVFNSFGPADALFNKRSNKYSFKPRRRMGELSGLVATLPFMDSGPMFNHARKMFRQELSPRSLATYYADIERGARTLTTAFVANPDPARLEQIIDRTLGTLFMKVSSGYVVNGDDDAVLKPIKQLADFAADILGGRYSIIDRLPFLCYLPRWAPGTTLLDLAEHWRGRLWLIADRTANLVREDLTSGTPSTSFMGNLYGNPRGGMDLDEAQFKFIAVTMSAGGMLPLTSSTLGFLLAMALFPAIQQRAQAELDHVLGGSRLPALADRPALPYISALILELYRWAPIAPLIARKTLEDDEVAGYRIPKGATVVANNWAITRDPERYLDPHTFRPERFLTLFDSNASPAEKECILDPRTYAFGYGRRICPGLDFAEAILFATITHILTVCDISLAQGGPAPVHTPDRDIALKTVGAAARVMCAPCILKPRSADALALIMESAEA